MTDDVDQKLSDKFGVSPPEKDKPSLPVVKETTDVIAANAQPDPIRDLFEQDFQEIRGRLHAVALTGTDALAELMENATRSGNARDFEVLGQLMKEIRENGAATLDMYQKYKKIVEETVIDGDGEGSTGKYVQNNYYTSSELSRELGGESKGQKRTINIEADWDEYEDVDESDPESTEL